MSYEQIAAQQISKQAVTTYEDYKKIKGFKDVGYLLEDYVVSGGEVTKDLSRNDTIHVTDTVVSLDNNILSRDGHSFNVTVPNTTYYLDFSKDGDWHWGLTHNGSAGVDYLAIASVTTSANGLVQTITDLRGHVGGTRFKDDFGLEQYAKNDYVDGQIEDVNAQLAETEQKLIYKADLFRAASINYGKVLYPPDFANVPFDLVRGRDGKLRHNYDLAQYDTGDMTIYCDVTAANDSKDGLTPETANRSLNKSLEIAAARPETNIVIKIINGGLFYRNMIAVLDTIVITNKRITISTLEDDVFWYAANADVLTWSLSSGTSNVYEAARTNASGILDLRAFNRDEYDIPKPYNQVSSKAQCDATEGSWYTDGTTLYVHTIGSVAPNNTDIMGLVRVRYLPFTLVNSTLVIKNAYLLNGGVFEGLPITGDLQSKVILNNVKIGHSNYFNNSYNSGGGNGLEIINVGLTMSFNVTIGYSNRDGFNYHYTTPLVDRRKHLAVEFDCAAYDCGINDTNNNNNASTMHDGACVLRVGTWGFRTRGPIIADVNSSYSINYDCHTWDSFAATPSNKVAWKFHTDGTTISEVGKAILVNCSGGGDVAYGLYRAGSLPTEFTIQGFRGADLYDVTDVTIIP
jgi:hypothetical protein